MKSGNSEQLLPKLKDALVLSRKRPCFLGFLDGRETAIATEYLKGQKGASWLLWGGFEGAERQIAGVFPDYLEPDFDAFPIVPLTFSYRSEDVLTHRDFLGSFMALGVERSVVGDILPETGRCVVFLRREMAEYFCQNLKKIGRVGVRIRKGADEPLPAGRGFETINGIAASARLDCLVALVCRVSREKASGLIAAGSVSLNHQEIFSPSARVEEGNLISVRGKGRFRIDSFGPLTSKGRLPVQCRKYK